MENDTGVRKVVELIFGKKPTIPEKMLAQSSISSLVLKEDFSKKMKEILRMHKFIMYKRWISNFDIFYREMLSSHSKYVSDLMYACLYEHKCNRKAFDSFISAFVIVMNMSNEVHTKARIDFRQLNPDVIMVFYRNVLKSSFPEQGGFNGFVEYVCGHKYFEWNWDKTVVNLSDSVFAFDNFRPEMDENIMKEYTSYLHSKEPSEGMAIAMAETAMYMAREVLSTTLVKVPSLPSVYELIERLVAYRRKEKATKTVISRKAESTSTFETSHEDLSSNSVSKTYYVSEQREDIEWYENIIQAVIRHNRSNISFHENVKNQKQVEAERTLEQLKTSIESLTEILDDM